MKSFIVPFVAIIGLITFFVVINHKSFIHNSNAHTVQGESLKSRGTEYSSIPEMNSMDKGNHVVISEQVEARTEPREETKETSPAETIPVEGMFAAENNDTQKPKDSEIVTATTSFEGKSAPAAIPVLNAEDADKANKDALRYYNRIKMQGLLKNALLIIVSISCIVALMLAIPLQTLKRIRFLQVWDFIGMTAVSFAVIYCVLLIFQINRLGLELLTTLQPILTTPSLHLLVAALLLFFVVYIKRILPFLLECKRTYFFIIELLFAVSIGLFVICHLSIEQSSDVSPDYTIMVTRSIEWQTLPQNKIKEIIASLPDLTSIQLRRCYYSYYMLYKLFGCNYIVIELSQFFMHLALGINVFFLAKQCLLQEKIARLSMILYFCMPAQYLYLTIPTLDLWGGMLLCLNTNLIIFLFKKSFELKIYVRNKPVDSIQGSKESENSLYERIRSRFLRFAGIFSHCPWLFPLFISILLGIMIFWMEMVRNLQLMLCIPMFLFLTAVLVRRILTGKIKLFSQKMLFVCVLCLLVPYVSNKLIYKISDVKPYGSESIPTATILFNTPEEVREVVRFGDFRLTAPERRKDFFLDAATSYWYYYPSNYSRYLGTKMFYFSMLFYAPSVMTRESIKRYPQESAVYDLLVSIVRIIFIPLLLSGMLCILFFKRWNSFAFVPSVLFFFFFVMPTIGESQVRYTSLYYAQMCICAACPLLLVSKSVSIFRKKNMQTRFMNSVLGGAAIIIVLYFAVTSFLSSPSNIKKHQWINFHDTLHSLTSEGLTASYKEYTDGKYLLSGVFHPAVANTIPGKTSAEWVIQEHTEEGREYLLYGYLIAPLINNADLSIMINGTKVWDNTALDKIGRPYSNDTLNISNERIIFLDDLKFTAKKENILRVEIVPKSKSDVDFALSAWGMVPCK